MSKLVIANRVPPQYHRGSIFEIVRLVEAQVNQLAEGKIHARHGSQTAAPTTGLWERGDIVWNSEPSASGTIGWVCVAGGEPGTWKTWGAISA